MNIYPIFSYADSKNTLSSLKGSGTQVDPYLIEEAADLYFLQRCIEERQEVSKGKYFKMTNDIRLNDRVLNDDGTLVSDTAGLAKWKPIGEGQTLSPYYAFQGFFDGGGHTIYGIYINDISSDKAHGLFGFVHRDAVVSNLRIADSYIHGSGASGGICGECYDGLITDCESSAVVISSGWSVQAGGITGILSGSDGRLFKCTNSGQVTGESYPDEYGGMYNCYTGGVCGNVTSAKIDSCYNDGRVLADGWGAVGGVSGGVSGGAQVRWSVHRGHVSSTVKASIGGIVGNNSQTIMYCKNEGKVAATVKGSCLGGIAGYCGWNSNILDSENNADIISEVDSVFVGGIVGNMEGGNNYGKYYTPKVYRCTNNAVIRTTDIRSQAGGISGKNYYSEIYDSRNTGHVISQSLAGGITPLCEYHSNISGCSNTGHVEGAKSTGGIVGETNGYVKSSWNSGLISNRGEGSNAGGIAGYTSSSITDCFNTGEIYNAKLCGGIAGNDNYKALINSCYNSGYIHTSADGTSVAGISGGNGSVKDCYNVGKIQIDGDNSTAGGIAVNVWVSFDSHGNRSGSSVKNSFNMGRILIKGSGCKAGNIVGSYKADDVSGLINNCYYLEDALTGENFSSDDTENEYQIPLEADGFKTLASNINVKEYWYDESPYAFSQGYYRPVLNGSTSDVTPLYYEVVTLGGDSALVDLGEPTDNTLFTAEEPAGLMSDVYNFLYDNTVRRAMLVDKKDFYCNETFTAQSLSYTRNLMAGHGAACLPFDINDVDLPEGTLLLNPRQITDNAVILSDTITSVRAGQPFLFKTGKDIAEWNINKHSVKVVAVPVNESLLNGTFTMYKEWEQGCYVPAEEPDKYCLVNTDYALPAFRAYIQAYGISSETLTLANSGDIPTGIENPVEGPVITSGNHCIRISLSSPEDIKVYSVSGVRIYSNNSSDTQTIIPVYADGLYIVCINGKPTKVFVGK